MSIERKRRTGKNNRLSEIQKPRGYERGLDIDEIVGVTDYTGDLMYLIRWQNCDELDLLPASEINEKNPDIVISFYEKRCPLKKQARIRAAANVPIAIREPSIAGRPDPSAEQEHEADSEVQKEAAGEDTMTMDVDDDAEETQPEDTNGGLALAQEPEGNAE